MSTKKKTSSEADIHIELAEGWDAPFEQKDDPFARALEIINNEVNSLRTQSELQADCIRRQDAQIRDLERGVSVTYHNGRPDRVIVDSTSVLEYAKKYMKE